MQASNQICGNVCHTMFLVACTRLYKPLCRSVGPSVRRCLRGARDLWRSALLKFETWSKYRSPHWCTRSSTFLTCSHDYDDDVSVSRSVLGMQKRKQRANDGMVRNRVINGSRYFRSNLTKHDL
mgnify:CR=1 FL=1